MFLCSVYCSQFAILQNRNKVGELRLTVIAFVIWCFFLVLYCRRNFGAAIAVHCVFPVIFIPILIVDNWAPAVLGGLFSGTFFSFPVFILTTISLAFQRKNRGGRTV